jgi:hypothetical protein
MNLKGTMKGEKTEKSVTGLSILIYENGLHGKNLVGIGKVESSDGKFSIEIKDDLKIRKDSKFDIVIGVGQLENRLQQFPTFKQEAIDINNIQNVQIKVPDTLIDDWQYWCLCIPVTGHLYKQTILADGTVMKCPVVGAQVCAIDLIRPVLCPMPNICDIFPQICDPAVDIRDICEIHPEICEELIIRPEVFPGPDPIGPDPIIVKDIEAMQENIQRIKDILQVKFAEPNIGKTKKASSKELPEDNIDAERLVVLADHLTDTFTLVERFEPKPIMDSSALLSKSLIERIIDAAYGYVVDEEVVGCDITDENGFFSICVPRYRIWRPCRDNSYDIVFRATKEISGVTLEIYRENIGSARILPGGGMVVELITTAPEIPCIMPHPSGICNATNGYIFWGVGRLSVAQIQNGLAEWYTSGQKDSPFAGTIDIKICFSDNFVGSDQRFNGYYYQIRAVPISDSASAPPPDTPGNGWFTIQDEIPWSVYTTDWFLHPLDPPTNIAPIPIGTERGLYKIDNKLIFNTNVSALALRLTTNRALFGSSIFNGVTHHGNGKYAFRVRIFHESSPGIISEVTSLADKGAPGAESPLILRFDNTPPFARLRSIIGLTVDGHTSVAIEGGMSGHCPIYSKSQVSSLNIMFDAQDDKYFRAYYLQYFTGHSIHALLNPVDGHQIYTSMTEPGRSYGFFNKSCIWDISTMSPCAYQIRLDVYDRRQNGYSGFGPIEDTFHLTITG